MKANLGDKQADLDKVNQTSTTLLQRVPEDSGDYDVVRVKVDELSSKYNDLHDKLRAKEEALEEEVGKVKEFNDKVKELDDWLDEAKDKLNDVGPISTDPEAVKKQLEQIEVSIYSGLLKAVSIFVLMIIIITIIAMIDYIISSSTLW